MLSIVSGVTYKTMNGNSANITQLLVSSGASPVGKKKDRPVIWPVNGKERMNQELEAFFLESEQDGGELFLNIGRRIIRVIEELDSAFHDLRAVLWHFLDTLCHLGDFFSLDPDFFLGGCFYGSVLLWSKKCGFHALNEGGL